MIKIDYHKTAHVEVDSDIFCALDDMHPWISGPIVICHTAESLKEVKEDAPHDSELGEFLVDLLWQFHLDSFDGDIMFELEN